MTVTFWQATRRKSYGNVWLVVHFSLFFSELVSANSLDEDIKVRWKLGNEDMTLNLHENNHVTSQVPVVLSRNGVLSRWNSTNAKVIHCFKTCFLYSLATEVLFSYQQFIRSLIPSDLYTTGFQNVS